MQTIKKRMIFMLLIMMCLGFAACSPKEEAKNGDDSNNAAAESQTPDEKETFEFEIEAKNWNVEGITVKYPLIVDTSNLKSSIKKKADEANDLIMNDMSNLIDTIKSNVDDEALTIDGVFNYSQITPTVLSICYEIDYYADAMAYPVSLYHTLTINLDQVAVIPLSDLFVIDETFVEDFKSLWMYSPFRETDLEAAGVNIKEEIGTLYSDQELIKLLSQPDTQYYLAYQGLIVSIEVPHALGDHLEMATNYEFLESSMKKEHPVWENYMFLDGEAIEETLD